MRILLLLSVSLLLIAVDTTADESEDLSGGREDGRSDLRQGVLDDESNYNPVSADRDNRRGGKMRRKPDGVGKRSGTETRPVGGRPGVNPWNGKRKRSQEEPIKQNGDKHPPHPQRPLETPLIAVFVCLIVVALLMALVFCMRKRLSHRFCMEEPATPVNLSADIPQPDSMSRSNHHVYDNHPPPYVWVEGQEKGPSVCVPAYPEATCYTAGASASVENFPPTYASITSDRIDGNDS